jgi:hypothetical protein
MAADPQQSLMLADESTGGPFVVGGVLRLPPNSVASVVRSIRAVKTDRGIAPDAKIHCRVLFAGTARLKSPFRHLKVDDCHALLADCIEAVLKYDGRWAGCYVNSDRYPRELRLGFPVTKKHLAGLVMMGAVDEMARITDHQYQLAFDPDPSQVDWGLLNRTQATHFARTHPQSIELAPDERGLLDMAGIAAYTLAQSILCQYSPATRKSWQLPFPDLLKKMKMHRAEFSYTPEG